jgi:hypothetical protein
MTWHAANMRVLSLGYRRSNQTVTLLGVSLALSTAFATEPAPRADGQSAVIFGTESPRHVGPPVDVTILRVNNEEYVLGLHWSARRFWHAPAGEVQIKVLCSIEYKAFIGRKGDSQPKLLIATLQAGHYYQFTCENFEPNYIDRGTDPAAIPELTPR